MSNSFKYLALGVVFLLVGIGAFCAGIRCEMWQLKLASALIASVGVMGFKSGVELAIEESR